MGKNWESRDKKQKKNRYGQQVDGESVKLIVQIQRKRANGELPLVSGKKNKRKNQNG